jgi:hypothetical protein
MYQEYKPCSELALLLNVNCILEINAKLKLVTR